MIIFLMKELLIYSLILHMVESTTCVVNSDRKSIISERTTKANAIGGMVRDSVTDSYTIQGHTLIVCDRRQELSYGAEEDSCNLGVGTHLGDGSSRISQDASVLPQNRLPRVYKVVGSTCRWYV